MSIIPKLKAIYHGAVCVTEKGGEKAVFTANGHCFTVLTSDNGVTVAIRRGRSRILTCTTTAGRFRADSFFRFLRVLVRAAPKIQKEET